MARNKTLANIHTKNYVAKVFEQRLREAGFTCPDDKLLCWYRVRNGVLLDTVAFYTQYTVIPVELWIYYEVSPFFVEPFYTRSVYQKFDLLTRNDCYRRALPRAGEDPNRGCLAPYSEDIMVYTDNRGDRGLYTLTDVILPYFDSVQTVEDCYRSHKEGPYYKDPLQKDSHFSYSSREFVDEAIFVGDTDIFPDLLARANGAVDLFKRLTASQPDKKEYAQALWHWQQIRGVFAEGTRGEYLQILQQRSMQNVAFMRKRLGLEIG